MSEQPAQPKPLWASKTFWANLGALAISLGAWWGYDIPEAEMAAITGGILSVANIALRLTTTKPVTTSRARSPKET